MGDNDYHLSKQLGQVLRARSKTIAVAESCTGGALAEAITAVSGASDYFDRGFVTYSNAAKEEMLGVDANLIQAYGAVSKEIAREMALGAIAHSRADIAASITGIAGPLGGSLEKPVGTVWIGLAFKEGGCECYQPLFSSGRKHIRVCSVRFALRYLLRAAERV